MAETIVETIGLTKRYGPVLAVDQVSLKVPKGGVFGLLGRNGSGKTTIMGMMLGLLAPTSGSIRLFGEEHADLQEALRRIGAIIETPAFYPYLSGRNNLRYFQGISYRRDPAEIGRLLELVGLGARARSKFSTYSLGMKQRLGIAFALLGHPDLILLDEPTNGLDPAGMQEVRALVRRLAAGGQTVLLSSHLLHEVEQVCDDVAILSRGHLIAQGKVADLLHQHSAVRVRTTDDARARPILRSLPWVTEVKEQDGYLIAAAPLERSGEITAALAGAQVYVTEMGPVQLSLERYFLEITAEENQKEPAV